VWLASEILFFGSLFAAYFTLRGNAHGPWPPKGVELEVWPAALFTVVLVGSSATMQMAVRAAVAGRGTVARRWLALTAALASVFLANQAREWHDAGFGLSSHAFGSCFFVMTGFHGLHVLGGVFAMVLFLVANKVGTYPAQVHVEDRTLSHNDAPLEVLAYYWHFVDVVWVALFATLFFT